VYTWWLAAVAETALSEKAPTRFMTRPCYQYWFNGWVHGLPV